MSSTRNIYAANDQLLTVYSTDRKTKLFVHDTRVQSGIYVAPNGTGTGSISSPTNLSQALSIVKPGETIYLRGGTYKDWRNDTWYQFRIALTNVTISNYLNEQVIFDFTGRNFGTASKVIFQLNKCYNVKIKGIRVTNCTQPGQSPVIGFNVVNSHDVCFENCTADHIGGQGFKIGDEAWGTFDTNTEQSYNITYKNCDSFANEDMTSPTPYDGADGMGLNWNSENQGDWFSNVTFIGCRSYHNSDDGFDFFATNAKLITIDTCWSFSNGKNIITNFLTGNGMGFKLGPARSDLSLVHQFDINNCIAAFNRGHGFDQNTIKNSSIHKLSNNIAYQNDGTGFMFYYSKWHPVINAKDEFTNNVSQGNLQDQKDIHPLAIQTDNSWQTGIFYDLSYITKDKLMASRDINGNLPTL